LVSRRIFFRPSQYNAEIIAEASNAGELTSFKHWDMANIILMDIMISGKTVLSLLYN
jgi:hypothetical protein